MATKTKRSRRKAASQGKHLAGPLAAVEYIETVPTQPLGFVEKWNALPSRTKWLIGGAAVGVLLFIFRKPAAKAAEVAVEKTKEAAKAAGETISKAAGSVQLAAVRALMPKGTEYIADLAFELGPKYDISPYVVLGMTYAESNFGRALKPAGPGGTGDFIPRNKTRCVARDAKGNCSKTLEQLVKELNFPVREEAGKLIPTTRGWGHGLYQIDLMSHVPFIASGKWADAREAMEYALQLYAKNREQIKKAVPSIGPVDLLRATIAAYNAGAGGVIKALKAGVPADQLDKGDKMVTYHAGYVDKIMGKAKTFTPGS